MKFSYSKPLPPPHPLPLPFLLSPQYLRQTLSGFICVLLEVEDDCEVDPLKLQPGASLRDNQAALTALVERAWLDILSSFNKFPRYAGIYTKLVHPMPIPF